MSPRGARGSSAWRRPWLSAGPAWGPSSAGRTRFPGRPVVPASPPRAPPPFSGACSPRPSWPRVSLSPGRASTRWRACLLTLVCGDPSLCGVCCWRRAARSGSPGGSVGPGAAPRLTRGARALVLPPGCRGAGERGQPLSRAGPLRSGARPSWIPP